MFVMRLLILRKDLSQSFVFAEQLLDMLPCPIIKLIILQICGLLIFLKINFPRVLSQNLSILKSVFKDSVDHFFNSFEIGQPCKLNVVSNASVFLTSPRRLS